MKGDRVILVLSTVPESESACITETLVSERLVACANAMPVRSCYRWKGEICREREELLIMKTRENLFARVMDRFSRRTQRISYMNECVPPSGCGVP